ncbi:Zn-dependent hydrolase YycJ/WalJ [Geomicrobium sp. JCM 19037]|uniref:MBL fold metallo-hydrolase n=1 Tax=Geomicrobium sp. JCM 19037 TaxID=1460634 RepID=UPI00045F30D7|nr:MBL fold metallo-hydrolase [Geomicrobium sp. JCM 19037]GAK05640.1 Zn-dependent hydrolase YycJ/WalJ [Geomicrobium sp. JCM 19037]
MKVNILESGSKGNCIALTADDGTSILIDAGVAKTKIEKRLLEVGVRVDRIHAIFITHAHGDHIRGLPLADKYSIDVWATEGEFKSIKTVDEEDRNILNPYQNTIYDFEGYGDYFSVSSFSVHHDALEPVGYTVSTYNKQVAVCLDTGKVDEEMIDAMGGSDTYIIEANHDPTMLEHSIYPPSVKARVASHIGHLSNEQTADALSKLIKGKGERIYLTHLSSKNNMPALAKLTVKRRLKQLGYVAGRDYEIEVV